MMKLLVLSTGDVNGAYEAAYRFTKIARETGIEAVMLVKNKSRNDPFIILATKPKESNMERYVNFSKKILRKLKLFPPSYARPATNPNYLFLDEDETVNHISGAVLLSYITFKPDVVIAGMTNGFVNTNVLSEIYSLTHAKVYTWMADMAPITGGCHYAWDCRGYELECKNCPAVINGKDKDWPHKNLMIKQENVSNAGIRVIGMSEWTVQQAKNSRLFKNQQVILNTNSCIDTSLFNNKNRAIAKLVFDLPVHCKVIFTGSQNIKDKRKGVSYFIDALNILWIRADEVLRQHTYVLVAGRDNLDAVNFAEQIPFKKHFIDYIKDYRLLVLAYNSADVFVCASIEDSGPMMVSEALACGTPVVGFNMGVVSNMVQTGYNGYKAELKNSKDLANGIEKILKLDKDEFDTYSKNAVRQVEQYSSERTLKDILDQLA